MRSLWNWRRPLSRTAPPRRARLGVESLEERCQPATLVAPDLLTQCDTGTSMYDNITRETRPTFAGTTTSPSGTSITLIIDNVPLATYTVTLSGGDAFTLQPPTALADGVHTVRFYDSKSLAMSNILTFTVDHTPPAPPPAPTLVSAANPADVVVEVRGIAGDRLRLYVAGQSAALAMATGAAQTVHVNFTALGINPSAAFDMYVVAEDVAGNVSSASALTSTTPAATPTAPTDLRLAAVSDTGVFDNDGITDQTTLTFTGTATPGQTIALTVDNVAWTSQVVGTDGTFSLTAGPLAAGAHQASVTARSAAGVLSTPSAPVAFTIDLTPPTISDIAITPSNLSPNNDQVQESGVFRFHLSEPSYVVVHFLDIDGFDLGAIPLDRLEAGDNEFELAVPQFDEGTYTIVVIASDLADNIADLASTTFTIDLSPPTVPTFTYIAGPTPNPASGSSPATMPIQLNGTGEPGTTIEVTDGSTLLGSTTVASDGTWTFQRALVDGVHPLTALARDLAGNVTVAAAQTITIDTTIPVVPANLPPTLTVPANPLAGYRNGQVVVGSALAAGDPDSSRLLVLLSIDEGVISAPVTQGLNFVSGNDTSYISFEGPIAAVNAALAALVFKSTPGYTGTVNVVIAADDLGLNGSGGAKQASANFSYNVSNRAPQIVPSLAAPAYSMNANTALDVAAPGLKSMFADLDGDTLTIALTTAPPVGTVTVNADGSFRYVPPIGYTGTVKFAVQASDGADVSSIVWVTIDVNAAYGLRRSR